MVAMPDLNPLLSDAARGFLAELHTASVATLDADGAPRQTVAWYRLDPDDRIVLNSRTPRRWCENLLRDGRVALSVVDGADPYRWLGLTGVVDEVVTELDRTRDDIVALAHRYHPEGPSAASIAGFRTEPRVTFMVRVMGVHDHLED